MLQSSKNSLVRTPVFNLVSTARARISLQPCNQLVLSSTGLDTFRAIVVLSRRSQIGAGQEVASNFDLVGRRNSPCGRSSIASVVGGGNAYTKAFRCVPRHHRTNCGVR